jgi:hypothetical protein
MSASSKIEIKATVKSTPIQVNSVSLFQLSGQLTWAATSLGVSVLGMGVKAAMSALKNNSAHAHAHESNVYTISELRLQGEVVSQQVKVAVASQQLSTLDSAKVAVLATCAATPYKIPATAQVDLCVQQIYTAANTQQLQVAEQQLLRVLEIGNQQVLTEFLVAACSRASVKVGFDRVKVTVRNDGKTAVVATNFSGQSLNTEIDTADRVNITTEVDGFTDGSCDRILDRFEQALDEEGVIRDGTPKRKFTGGVPELDITKEERRKRFALSSPTKVARTETSNTSKEEQAIIERRRQQVQQTRQ